MGKHESSERPSINTEDILSELKENPTFNGLAPDDKVDHRDETMKLRQELIDKVRDTNAYAMNTARVKSAEARSLEEDEERHITMLEAEARRLRAKRMAREALKGTSMFRPERPTDDPEA